MTSKQAYITYISSKKIPRYQKLNSYWVIDQSVHTGKPSGY